MNLNTFLLFTIKFSWEDNRSYKEKTKRWVINNRELNLLFLERIIDGIYQETYRSLTLLSSEVTFNKLKLFNTKYKEFKKEC